MFSAFLICVLDLFCKYRVEHSRSLPKSAGSGQICIDRVHNYGLMCDLLQKKPGLARLISGTVFGLLCLLAIPVLNDSKRPALLRWGLALMLGGGCSNTADRLIRGYVVDYIRFPALFGRLTFNLGDFSIFLGAILTAISGAQTTDTCSMFQIPTLDLDKS